MVEMMVVMMEHSNHLLKIFLLMHHLFHFLLYMLMYHQYLDKVYKMFDQEHLDIDLVSILDMYHLIEQLQILNYIYQLHN